ncbi:MAG: NAD(P)/FAD-dependent oxidoreductase [Lachnospiraceae bacterium]|nr:NAD(P)/FAD-dependent oxidoreductase [Lachnospiraceae bacterium]
MKKVIIIGAGPAGLTAGIELIKDSEDYQVTILEETGDIGGISRTVRHNGNRMDIGGHRFFSKDQKVMQWWNELLPSQGKPAYDDKVLKRKVPLKKDGPDPEKEDIVMLTRNRVSRIYYKKKFFDYPVKMNWQTVKNMGFLTTIEAGFSYVFACVFKKKEDSLENFYINRFGKKLYTMFFEGYTEKLWGRHPREIDASWGAQRVKGLSIVAILKDIIGKLLPGKRTKVETSLIEEFYYPKYGPGQLWEVAADKFVSHGGNIKKNCKVIGVKTYNHKVVSVIYKENGSVYEIEADYVLSSMPLKDLVLGMNDVPEQIKTYAEGLPYRDFVTVGLLVDKLNLKNETKLRTLANIVPDCWIYVQDVGVKLGRIQIFNNWSPYMVANPEKEVWIGLEYFCNEGDKYWKLSEEKWKTLGAKELIKMGVINSEEQIKDYHKERVKKAYPAYFDTYEHIGDIVGYVNQFENLYCIGRNGQHRYNNMDHSMVTSFEAVKNIKTNCLNKDNVWNVNTEAEYHEEKNA